MLAELFEKLKSAAEANRTPVTRKIDLTEDHCFLDKSGEMIVVKAERLQSHHAFDLSAIQQFAEKWSMGCIWFNRDRVRVFGTEEETTTDMQVDSVTLDLAQSPQIADLIDLDRKRDQITQANLRTKFKTIYRGCISDNVIAAISAVRAVQGSNTDSDIVRGKASVGKSIRSEMAGVDAIPEYVTVNVPIFASKFMSVQPVECYLDLIPENVCFKFYPLPGQVEAAIARAERELGDAIAEFAGKVPVYYGVP